MTKYCIYKDGTVVSEHRTLSNAQKALARVYRTTTRGFYYIAKKK